MYEKEVASILDSYEKTGVINLSEGMHYPPKESVANILMHIKELLFPGFFGCQALLNHDISTVTEDRLANVSKELGSAIEKSLLWNPSVDKRLDIKQAAQASQRIIDTLFEGIPDLRLLLKNDAQAMYDGDPAANSVMEVILSYPGFQAVIAYRIGHFLYEHQVPLIPRMITEIAHQQTGIDIHPGAKIGHHFCIDHGTGIVIGETAVIGNHVKLYQGVTLGAFSTKKSLSKTKRHPTLKDNVTVYSMSTILGGDTIIGENSVVGGNVWLTHSLEANSKIYLSQDSKAYTLIKGDK